MNNSGTQRTRIRYIARRVCRKMFALVGSRAFENVSTITIITIYNCPENKDFH